MKRPLRKFVVVLFLTIVALSTGAVSAYYDPGQGRFISRDPIGYASGEENLYEYVGGKSLVASDPLGFQAQPPKPKKCGYKECKDCIGGKWWKKGDKTLKELYDSLREPNYILGRKFGTKWRKGCKPKVICCKDTTGECRHCLNKNEFGGQEKQVITICSMNHFDYSGMPESSNSKCDHFYETLRHELQHLLDRCTGYDRAKGRSKCDICLCDEFRSLGRAGQCKPGSVYYQIGFFGRPYRNEQDCLLSNAIGSCRTACKVEFDSLTTQGEYDHANKVKGRCKGLQ